MHVKRAGLADAAMQLVGAAGHGAALFAAGHIAGNAATLLKDKSTFLKNALVRSGTRMGLHGKDLHPTVKTVATNVLGPEFLNNEFGTANRLARRAHEAAGGDPQAALGHLKTEMSSLKEQGLRQILPHRAFTTDAIKGLPEDFALKAPGRLATAANDPKNRKREIAGHALSIAGMAAADPAAPLSAVWNQAKRHIFGNATIRDKVRKIPHIGPLLDPARRAAHDIARGVEQGRAHPALQLARKLTISPEVETARNAGAVLRTKMDEIGRSGAVPDLVHHLRSEAARDVADEGLKRL